MRKENLVGFGLIVILLVTLSLSCQSFKSAVSETKTETNSNATTSQNTNLSTNTGDESKTVDKSESSENSFLAIDLSKQYKNNKKEMDAKYKGKEITVSGTISFNSSKPGELGLISLEGVGVTGDIKCWYEKEDQPAFGKLQKGQEVTVKGTFSGRFSSPDLQYCKVLSQ